MLIAQGQTSGSALEARGMGFLEAADTIVFNPQELLYVALRQARSLALDGWVRNCPDGSVELLAIGDEVALERMAEACRGGPPAASVADVQALAADDDGSVGFAARS